MGFITKVLEKSSSKRVLSKHSQPLLAEITRCGFFGTCTLFIDFSINFKRGRGKLFSPFRKQHNNKENSATDLFERLNFEQSFFKTVFLRNSLQNFIKNNLCKVSRRSARDRDRNPSRPRPSRPRLQKTGSRDTSRDQDQVSRLHHWLINQNGRYFYKTYLATLHHSLCS